MPSLRISTDSTMGSRTQQVSPSSLNGRHLAEIGAVELREASTPQSPKRIIVSPAALSRETTDRERHIVDRPPAVSFAAPPSPLSPKSTLEKDSSARKLMKRMSVSAPPRHYVRIAASPSHTLCEEEFMKRFHS